MTTDEKKTDQLNQEPLLWDILLAEDDRMLNLVLTMQLESCQNLRVRKTYDGSEAMAMIKEAPPDLLILDVSMPGLNGFEIVRLLREDENLRRTRCIIHTSFDLTESEKADLKLGETRYMTKTASDELLTVALDLLSTSVKR